MTERRSSTRRKDRQEVPQVRIPDSSYEHLLPYLTPYEFMVWFALKAREWRKDRRGYVRIGSLRQVAKDIRMPLGTAHKAFQGLRVKSLAKQMPNGSIRVLTPDFTTAFTTVFTTEVSENRQRTVGESVHQVNGNRSSGERGCSPGERQPGLSGFKKKPLTHGSTERRNRSGTGKARTVPLGSSKKPKKRISPDENRARLTSSGDDARFPKPKEEKTMTDEIAVRKMDHDTATKILRQIKQDIIAKANEGAASIAERKDEQQVREDERREVLRQQAAELQAEEDATR